MNTKQLKQKILSLAITGRLVPQDPRDEPASELLHRINPKATPLETDQPLPEGWCATNLSTLCELTDGENVQNRELINLDAKFLRGQREGNKLKSGRLIPAGSLVILVDGENSGEVFKTPIEGYQGSTFKKLVIDENMHEEFVLQVINSHRTRLKGNKKGSAIPHLNKKLFREIQVPIPPLAEQKRIAEAVERWFAKIDQLEHDCEALSKFGKQVRKKLLTSAITGRLVPQDSNDEPASELLHRINPKATPLETEQPLPEGWCVCTVATVAKTFTGDSINKEEKEKKYTGLSTGYNYIATKDVGFDGVIDYDNGIKIPFKTKFKIAHKGSTLLCIEGGSAGRKIGLLTEDVCFVNKLCAFEPKGIDEKYLYYYLQSPVFVEVFGISKTGLIGGVTKTALASLPVYLPPLAEQKRIVEKLEALFAVLDNLDALTA